MPKLFSEFEQQLARLKAAAGAQNDTAFAQLLGISSGAITNARARGIIPKKWFSRVATAFNVDSSWLINGLGPMRRDERVEQPGEAVPMRGTDDKDARIRELERELAEAKEEALRAKEEALRAREEAVNAYKQAFEALRDINIKGGVFTSDVPASAPNAPLISLRSEE